jgi:hypothetical protein
VPEDNKNLTLFETQGEAREFALRVAKATNPDEQSALLTWLRQLVVIRDSQDGVVIKAANALKLTASSGAVKPALKIVWAEFERVGWDERSFKAKLGIVGAGLGLVTFGWAGAGIAALGGAIGVPLWVVLGAGGLAAGALIEELSSDKKDKK